MKSGGNILRDNLVIESYGEFVLRQGHGNLVERNIFLGGQVKGAGGVRLTSNDHIVRNNYFQGLRSSDDDGQSAIRLMNGVPNSPDHKHFQVNNAIIENNTIVDSQVMTVGFASDKERTVPPANIKFNGNVIIKPLGNLPFEVKSTAKGIESKNNVIVKDGTKVKHKITQTGFNIVDGTINKSPTGLLYFDSLNKAKLSSTKYLTPVNRSDVGVNWYE